MAMDWLGIQWGAALPAPGFVFLDAQHQPALVALAYLVACAGSYATLDINERLHQAERRRSRRQWSALGAGCLGGGIWAMHFISMLAFEPAMGAHYDLGITLVSLLIAAIAGSALMAALARPQLSALAYALCALGIGGAIAAMHYVGMAAMHAHAQQHYRLGPFALSLALAVAASLAALLLGRGLRQEHGRYGRWLKLGAGLAMGAGIVGTHFTGMWALQLVAPAHASSQAHPNGNSLQLALTVACITLLLFICCLTATLSAKQLQRKERDLRKMNALVDELNQARAALEYAASHDTLTDLLNRRGFNQAFEAKLAQRNGKHKLALMCLDIDHFKAVNDQHGHDAGDAALRALADALRAVVRQPGDLAARLGGDEFCVVLELYTREEALAVAERIRRCLAAPLALAGCTLQVTTSIGICLCPDQGSTASELLKRADVALYRCKALGRDTAVVYDATPPAAAVAPVSFLRPTHQNDARR
ncbi:diguanylate cyclase domain-containing protein [Pseudomonas sp. NPDC007930]|uniref:diguanylate cyclase domain-containing protein n=1 Tax=Pseudomonas sp. NPDC007930 TaxID=3364417 RepID=UPI0036E1C5AF